ncbi:hypothetical protein EST38_g1991 [Candolleomyces aberdarensis]|uniref:Uncharacterized protein n=1 Tax=Candolleomyces aberdarensis TaxID=2316362 RepID=A0A4Q2DUE1_9AGAR|nr:hypothetical protein EST38_g1991 [Candolleomyces aberdarensis]
MSSPTPRDPQPDEEDKNPIDELDENAASENAQPGQLRVRVS